MFARIIVLNCMNINRFCELVIVYYFKESFNMMFKRIFFFIFLLLTVFSFSVNATEDELYSEQYNSSGVAELFGQLPEETQKALENAGITSSETSILSSVSISDVFGEITNIALNEATSPFGAIPVCIGIIILCSLVEGFKVSLVSSMGGVGSTVGTLCVVACIVVPLCGVIQETCAIIKGACGFMTLYIPIMGGLMLSAGEAISGTSYCTAMMTAAQTISALSANLFLPLLNIFLGVSVMSSISPRMRLSSLCDMLYKVCKWTMTFCMSVFVSVLTFQSVITTRADGAGGRALKFAVSSFVPVVGGALGESLASVRGGLKLLKSGSGVFMIFGIAFMFLPVLIRCLLWIFSLNISASIGDILGTDSVCKLLHSVSKVVSTITAVLLCVMTVFILSTVLILIIGGAGS